MVNAGKVVHALVVVAVVGVYTVVLMRGLNTHLTNYVFSNMQEQMDKNPHMRDDYETFKEQLRQQEEHQKQIKKLEEQAKEIRERLSKLSEPVPPAKYVHMEGFHNIESRDPGNQTRAGLGAREDL